jgi:acyl-coenzyme A synthetase/AMP-(fatty) acid ligase
MSGYLEPEGLVRPRAPLFPTGDLVERRGDRVLFLGRRGQSINVGGRKAFPTEIEAAVLEVPGVRAVRVSALPSPLVGQLVRAEVVLEPDLDPEAARRAVLAHCRERLTPHMVPRRLEFVRSLEHTPSRKIARR